jgi:hypothetical protein
MKKIIILVFIGLMVIKAQSQNLLSNGSFESFYGCPVTYSQAGFILDSVYNWYSHAPYCSHATVLHNNCGNVPPGWGQIPYSHTGWQYPRTGNSYIDMAVLLTHMHYWFPADTFQIFKSFASVRFDDTMQANKMYNIRLYISIAEFPRGRNVNPNSNFLSYLDSLGFYFSHTKDTFNYSANCHGSLFSQRPFEPQVYDTSGYHTDTCNWVAINIKYLANGGEKYMTFGNFQWYKSPFTNILTQNSYSLPTDSNNFGISLNNRMYIDDVAIWLADTIPPPADAGNDTLICRGGKARLGTHSYGDYIYEWWPSATLSNDSSGIVWASPQTTTTYYLQATDDIYTKTLDSITVYVNNCGQNDTTVCMEQQFQMGSTNNPLWNYQWSPSNWLSSDTVGMPLCNPIQNTNYQLFITNQNGDTIAHDSTKIIVGACFNASAGNDSLICKNDSLQIGMQHHNFLTYAWSPHFMISDTTIGNPIVWNDTNTTYYLKLTDTLGRITYDSVLVGVHICIGIDDLENNPIKLSVYPNPAEDMLVFEFSEMLNTINIRVFDILGKEVISKEFSHKRKIDIDISSLSSGIYNYEVGKYFKGKFIKK